MLIQAVWIFWVFKQKGFTLKPLHSVSFIFSLLRKNCEIVKTIFQTCHRESRKLLKEEVSSVRATHEIDLQGAQERQQQQGVVPFLGMFLYHLKLLDIGMADDLEKFKVIRRIQLLQQAANAYDLEPDERFGAWFQAMEPISVHESYWVSCRLEPAHQKASKMRLFRRKRNRTSSSLGPSECQEQQRLNPGAQYSFGLSMGLDPSSSADQAWDRPLPSSLWDSVASS
ncbi:ral guanine nucleotide dissociation stimulator-like isoform X3 [Diceros bicornis minor]|uniref:ral guanine nucleotide dissociation stimulator-like isoform X3 n=1 Tax=Diceros bicornis minor TaxID=77932 RepID=UPI0026EBB1D1|nr:ral guanine nucleotide dissociation stimulator-like isoform X3 [Diceros bicornis minor]